jgi:hypothetical protein
MYKNSVSRVISSTECVIVAEAKSSNNHLVRFADFLPWRVRTCAKEDSIARGADLSEANASEVEGGSREHCRGYASPRARGTPHAVPIHQCVRSERTEDDLCATSEGGC